MIPLYTADDLTKNKLKYILRSYSQYIYYSFYWQEKKKKMFSNMQVMKQNSNTGKNEQKAFIHSKFEPWL